MMKRRIIITILIILVFSGIIFSTFYLINRANRFDKYQNDNYLLVSQNNIPRETITLQKNIIRVELNDNLNDIKFRNIDGDIVRRDKPFLEEVEGDVYISTIINGIELNIDQSRSVLSPYSDQTIYSSTKFTETSIENLLKNKSFSTPEESLEFLFSDSVEDTLKYFDIEKFKNEIESREASASETEIDRQSDEYSSLYCNLKYCNIPISLEQKQDIIDERSNGIDLENIEYLDHEGAKSRIHFELFFSEDKYLLIPEKESVTVITHEIKTYTTEKFFENILISTGTEDATKRGQSSFLCGDINTYTENIKINENVNIYIPVYSYSCNNINGNLDEYYSNFIEVSMVPKQIIDEEIVNITNLGSNSTYIHIEKEDVNFEIIDESHSSFFEEFKNYIKSK